MLDKISELCKKSQASQEEINKVNIPCPLHLQANIDGDQFTPTFTYAFAEYTLYC